MKAITLTGNDMAIAEQGLCHLIKFWKELRPRSNYARQQQRNAEETLKKFSDIGNFAYPYGCAPEDWGSPGDFGGEPIVSTVPDVVKKTRRAAHQYNRTIPKF